MIAVSAGEKSAAHSATLIVTAAAAGSVFEWYDFYIYGSILAIISKQFFGGLNDSAAYIFALLGFGAGFAARPFGALVFGRLGDRWGRKYAFLITISLMGVGTFAIGLLPNYAQAGILSPALLITMRLLQGFAVGGEYGGAVVYVAEHAPAGQRGLYTGWLQTTAALGLVAALVVVLATRTALGEDAFAAWGWRIPFLASLALLAMSLWVRMRLHESPVFEKLRAQKAIARAPLSEAFLRWRNLRIVLLALFGVMAAHAVIWYSIHFYSQIFLERVLKVEPAIVAKVMIVSVSASVPLYVFFGWLSDKVGRKPLMLSAMALSALLFFPLYHAMTEAANPALASAQARAPVSVVADPAQCSLQFDPVGASQFVGSCDIAKSALAAGGVSYRNVAAAPGVLAGVQVGTTSVPSVEGRGLSKPALDAAKKDFDVRLKAALAAAGYPAKADPVQTDAVRLIGILFILMVLSTMLYGPLAATLVELFPTRIRYSAMSLPYNLGNGWIGGFLPAVVVARVAATGDIYSGLWYPVAVAVVTLIVALLFLPETSRRDLERLDTEN